MLQDVGHLLAACLSRDRVDKLDCLPVGLTRYWLHDCCAAAVGLTSLWLAAQTAAQGAQNLLIVPQQVLQGLRT